MKTRAPLEQCTCLVPLACVLTFLSVSSSMSLGATLNVPADYSTIQAAINAASDGDAVIVQPATYRETINFLGKAITVRSVAPTDPQVVEATVIDGLWDGLKHGPIVTFENGESNGSVLAGFTITNGRSASAPLVGGILCRGASPTIESNTIAGNGGYSGVGGVSCLDGSAPLIRGNTIAGNCGSIYIGDAGGILCNNASSPTIEDNTITGNSGGGIACLLQSSPSIRRNLIAGHNAYCGGGIYCYYSEPRIEGNTIESNTAQTLGGGIACQYSAPTIDGNTIRGNSAPDREGGGIHCRYGSSPLIRGNVIDGNWATLGGGIACDFAAGPTIQDNDITGNRAVDPGSPGSGEGGAIFCHQASPTLLGNTITDNTACGGGGLFLAHSWALVEGNELSRNSAAVRGGAIGINGGAPTVRGNRLHDNTAVGSGGAVFLYFASATIEDNTIASNRCLGPIPSGGTHNGGFEWPNGGAIAWWYCGGPDVPVVRRNTMEGNTAAHEGGAMWIVNMTPRLELEDNVVMGNHAAEIGGGMLAHTVVDGVMRRNTFSGNSAGESGGGIWLSRTTIDMTEDCVTGNTAGSAGAGVMVASAAYDFAVTISRSVIAGNGRDNGLPGIAMVRASGPFLRAQVSECSVYDNGGLGIDAGGDGVTPNAPGDSVTDFPVFTGIVTADGTATATGTARPGSTVEVYAAAPDPTGYGEGKTYLQSLTAGPTGSFTCTVPVSALPITATATDASGNTSEFSPCIPDNQPPIAVAGGPYTVSEGGSTTVDAGTSSDPDEGDVLAFAWDLDNDGTFETPGQAVTFSAADLDGPSERTISVQVTDSSGLSATDAATVTVQNVAPTIASLVTSLDPIAANVSTTATVTFAAESQSPESPSTPSATRWPQRSCARARWIT